MHIPLLGILEVSLALKKVRKDVNLISLEYHIEKLIENERENKRKPLPEAS